MRAGQALGLFVCFMLVDWGPKCPSGCRIQGLIKTENGQNDDRIKEIRRMLEMYSTVFGDAHLTVTKAVHRIKQTLSGMGRFGDTYYQLVDHLNSRLIILQNKTNDQSLKLTLLQSNIVEQFKVISRLEVDIDIKIQSCKGSCAKSVVYDFNKESNIQMEKCLKSLTDVRLDSIVPNTPINILKMRLVKNSDQVTGFKSAPDVGDEYPKFWEEVHTRLMTLENDAPQANSHPVPDYYEGSFSTPTPMTSHAVSTGNGIDTQTGSMKVDAVSLTPDGINSTGRDDVALTHGVNITRRAETFLMHGSVDSGTEEPHFTTDSFRATSSYTSHSTETHHYITGSKTATSQPFTKDRDMQISNQDIFSDALFHNSERIDVKELSLPPASKGFSSHSTHTEADSSGDFTDYSNLGHFDDSVTVGSRKRDFPSTKEVASSKSKVSHTELFNISSGRQISNAGESKGFSKISNTTQLTLDPNLFFNEETGEGILDVQARSSHTAKVQKVKGYIGKDCDDIIQKHAFGDEDGLFKIKPTGSADVVTVYCDQSTALGGWVLVQQRMSGSVHFNRSWDEYKRGFGSIDGQGRGDVWLGNDILHFLTQNESVLRVELEDWSGNEAFAEYAVSVGSESESYVLNITNYVGNAGDALITGLLWDREHTTHANMKFSTYDRDNDKWEENCAQFYGGGWWYNGCQSANLNGIYYHGGLYDPRNNIPYEIENGVIWAPFKDIDYSLKVVKIKIRPIASI
ncbi:fibrinogen alpha chain isoform X2 [Mustelus asterias]